MTELDGMVQVAYLHNEHLSHSWHESMRTIRDHDLLRAVTAGADLPAAIEHGYRIARKPLNMRCGVGLVAHVRNYAARLFLDKTGHEWLLFIDTDMGFAADAVHRLLDEAADPAERPVVGALCFALMEAAADGMGGWRRTIVPTMYNIGNTQNGEASFCYHGDYNDGEVTPVAATGSAFLMIHRSVLEKLRAEHGDHWFDQMYDRVGDIIGEDIAFCARALKAGIIPVVHTGVKTTHHKEIWLSEEDYEVQRAVTVEVGWDRAEHIDLGASLTSLANNDHAHDGMLKLPQDLDRYTQIIDVTQPEVIVETGTLRGSSARWFADRGIKVITIDINGVLFGKPYADRVTQVVGDSADPEVAANVAELVAGRRCMVSLDSDHSAAHVAEEIKLYGPLVTPGCYLVVEDGIFGHAPAALRAAHGLGGMVGSPLDAIAEHLADNPDWSRDIAVERLHPASHSPAGWWVRNG